jgi:hypothetical protein
MISRLLIYNLFETRVDTTIQTTIPIKNPANNKKTIVKVSTPQSTSSWNP